MARVRSDLVTLLLFALFLLGVVYLVAALCPKVVGFVAAYCATLLVTLLVLRLYRGWV